MRIETSWDDFSKHDTRIADLLRFYGLPGIFYVPVNQTLGREDELADIAKDFEIGSHTVNHEILNQIPKKAMQSEVADSRTWLQQETGQLINSFCYPKGRYDQSVIDAVKAAGYKEARTTKVLSTKTKQRHFEIETSIHVYPRKEYQDVPWLDLAKELHDRAKEDDGTFRLWGHGWEIERLGEWENLESFFKHIA